MRRVKWVQTFIFVGVAVSMAGAFAVGVRAMQTHNHCLNGCGKGQAPPTCCEPPDCEFEYELRVTTAKVRSFVKAKKQTPSGPGQTPVQPLNVPNSGAIGAAFGRLQRWTGGNVGPLLNAKANALETLAAQSGDCIDKKPYITKQPFYVDYETSACSMSQGGQEINYTDARALEKAKDAAPQCREAVEADWYRAKTLWEICLTNKGLNAATLPDAEQKAAEAAQRSMQEQLSQFIQSCKPFAAKFKSARDAVKKAADMLKASGSKNIPPNKRQFSGQKKHTGSGRGK
jgi:hypothetical protein